MTKKILAGFVAALIAGPAFSADLPMPVKARAIAPSSGWAGWYFGVHAGYGWDPAEASFNPATFASLVPGAAVTASSGPFTLGVAPKGALGGLQIGHNWVNRQMLFGLEADFSFSNIKGDSAQNFSVTANDPDDVSFTGQFFLSQKLDYFGTLRGRLGLVNPNWLAYVTGGLAYGHIKTTMGVRNIVATVPANFTPPQPGSLAREVSSSDWHWGWALGGGGEWKVAPRWTVRGEYLYIHLASGGTSLAFTGASLTSNSLPLHIARLGLNYQFNP